MEFRFLNFKSGDNEKLRKWRNLCITAMPYVRFIGYLLKMVL